LKKWERKTPPPFSQSCSEKGVETGKSGVAPKIIVTIHTGFATFPAFFPGVLKNCQFLIALPSVHGAKNLSRLIMVQSILPQAIIVLSTDIGELTLLTKTQMAIGIETRSDAKRIGRHFARIVIHAADIEAFVRSW
jgi:hypothetical protein